MYESLFKAVDEKLNEKENTINYYRDNYFKAEAENKKLKKENYELKNKLEKLTADNKNQAVMKAIE